MISQNRIINDSNSRAKNSTRSNNKMLVDLLASNTGGRNSSSDDVEGAKKKLVSSTTTSQVRRAPKKSNASKERGRRRVKVEDKLRESELDCLDYLIADASPNTHEPPSNEQRRIVLASLDEALSSWGGDTEDEDSFDATRAVQKNQRGSKNSSDGTTRGQKNQRGRSLDGMMTRMLDRARKLVVRNPDGPTLVQKNQRGRSLDRTKIVAEEAKKIASTAPVRRAAKKSSASKKQRRRAPGGALDKLGPSERELLDQFIEDASPKHDEAPSNQQRRIVLASLDEALSTWDDTDDSFEF